MVGFSKKEVALNYILWRLTGKVAKILIMYFGIEYVKKQIFPFYLCIFKSCVVSKINELLKNYT